MEQETIANAITEVVSGRRVKASEIIKEVLRRKDTTEKTIRQELTKLKDKEVLESPSRGYYSLKKEGEPEEEKRGRLVHLRAKRKADPANKPAIILRRDDGTVWANVHMTLSVDVVNPMEYRVRGLKLDMEADAEFERAEDKG